MAKTETLNQPPRGGGAATLIEAIRQGIWEEMMSDKFLFVIGKYFSALK